ncbi:TonB-dependent receptor plug domain-containing protein [Rudanella paleaurantiibacter]|uniref:TonB-dependent receptor plug domain-containing protein n=1 Tax=Rudanella paleaurantiibacter TaxID=2614655 RepID=A0A7J5U3N0_9BACT|nr:TonB-dependent receptor [Rudanella paleaurantiibacter]KAB7732459.1 TonB-dependent receptor plug domain-containing protein [Rudanella paleaurantiibacter]
MRFLYSMVCLLLIGTLQAQTPDQRVGNIIGTVRDAATQELLIGVTIKVANGTQGVVTDTEGRYKLTLPVGTYNLQASYVGYQSLEKFNLVVTSGNDNQANFELTEENQRLSEVTVKANRATAAASTISSPNSIQRLTTEEIKTNPGGNFDISKVIQTLPGVGGSPGGLRNDIIIRGGAPNENVFYLDGIEIPVINHFQTQGGTGGPQGILNVSFIEDVTLSSSSFDARYDNALASVFQFKQREGNRERLQGNFRVSGTELALTTEGPLSEKTTFLASARRSYLQYFFRLIDLPIRPNYWDFQAKITHRFSKKTTLTAVGVGALDEFSFAVPREVTPDKEYTIRRAPLINQWNYTGGLALRHLIENGYLNIALSRNAFDNALDRFEDARQNDESARAFRLRSREIENKLRIDVNKSVAGWRYSYGVSAQYAQFNNDIAGKIRNAVFDPSGQLVSPEVRIRSNTSLDLGRFGAFVQVNRNVLNNRLGVSAGLRTDMNTFTTTGMNPLQTLSPRLALSYALNEQWNLNASVGRYFKMPIYTVLGYRDAQGQFVNRDNRYIASNHYVAGIEFLPNPTRRFTVEGFFKQYSNYPVSVRNGISLANLGADFNAIGNEAVTSTGKGQAYGVEVFFQQKLVKNLFVVASYTYVRSLFSGSNGVLVPSAWDNRHLFSGLLGRKFKRGWEMGLKYRFAGGAPFTPFDIPASQANFLALGQGIPDYSKLNTQRLAPLNQFDFRLDKKWNFRRTTLDLFLDVQNAFVLPTPGLPDFVLSRALDGSGYLTTDGAPLRANGSNGIPEVLSNNNPFVTPTIGFMVEF